MYHAQKLIDFGDFEKIFEGFYQLLKDEVAKSLSEKYSSFFADQLMQYNIFLTLLTEDRIYLLFKGLEELIYILENCQNLDIIYITLEVLMNLFSVDKKVCEDMLIGYSEEILFRLAFQVQLWFLNVNYGNDKHIHLSKLA